MLIIDFFYSIVWSGCSCEGGENGYLFTVTGVKKMKGFLSHEVPFPAPSDHRRSRVAGNGTEWEVKTIELSSPTSGGEQWAFLNFLILTAVKKTVPKLRQGFIPILKKLCGFFQAVLQRKPLSQCRAERKWSCQGQIFPDLADLYLFQNWQTLF